MLDYSASSLTVAVPVMGATSDLVHKEWERAVALGADLVEWRLDYFDDRLDSRAVASLGRELRDTYGIPVLATVRTSAEGGLFPSEQTEDYSRIVESAAEWADAVDVEIAVPGASALLSSLAPHTVTVASFHSFDARPSKERLQAIMQEMAACGASVTKVAWMVETPEELAVIREVQQWAAENLSIPAVVIAMGEVGRASRLGEAALLSAFTFARGVAASAPGQPTVEEIRASVEMLRAD